MEYTLSMIRKQLGKVRRKFGGVYRHSIHPVYLRVAIALKFPMAKTTFNLVAADDTSSSRELIGWRYGSKYLANYEMPTRKFIQKNVSSGDICIDIGANVGIISISMADAGLREKSQAIPNAPFVYAVEPSAKNRKILIRNLSKNDLTKYVDVSINPIGSRTHSVSANINSVFGRRIERKVYDFISLDDFVASKNIGKLKMIKIDVDGFEPDVLSGARKVLKNLSPIIIIELDPISASKQGHSTMDLISALNSHGYLQVTFLSENPISGNAVFAKPEEIHKIII